MNCHWKAPCGEVSIFIIIIIINTLVGNKCSHNFTNWVHVAITSSWIFWYLRRMKHSQFDDHTPDKLISKFSWSTTASCNRTAINSRRWATLWEKIHWQNPSSHQKGCTENIKMRGDLTITFHHWPCLLANNYNNNYNNNYCKDQSMGSTWVTCAPL